MAKKHQHSKERCVPELIQLDGRLGAIGASLLNESDRGCVIFGAEILNTELEALFRTLCLDDEQSIKNSVDPLFTGDAPLATFSARIRVAYAFRIIPIEIKRQLDQIRKLRNVFAHEPLTLDTPRCQQLLQNILDEDTKYKLLEEDKKTKPLSQKKRRDLIVFKFIYLAGRLASYRDALAHGTHTRITVKHRRNPPTKAEPDSSEP